MINLNHIITQHADAAGNNNNATTQGNGFQKVGSGALSLDGQDDVLTLGSGVWFDLELAQVTRNDGLFLGKANCKRFK